MIPTAACVNINNLYVQFHSVCSLFIVYGVMLVV